MSHATALSLLAAFTCHALALFAFRLPPPVQAPAEKTYLEVTLAASAPPVEARSVETPPPAPPAPPVPEPPPAPKPEPLPPPPGPKLVEPPPPPPKVETAPRPEPKPVEPPPPPLQAKVANAVPSPAAPVAQRPARETGEQANPSQANAIRHYQTVEQPYYLKRGKPEYPSQAKRLRQEGVVVLALFIDELGGLDKIEVVQSSGFPLLDEAAIAAERRSRFRPAYLRDRPVACRAEVPYRFVLPR